MSNIFLDQTEIEDYRKAAQTSVEILKELRDAVVIGVAPNEINNLAEKLCAEKKVKSSFKGVPGPKSPFPANVCICVNDQTLHAIPYSKTPFKSGDIVKVDFGIIYNGLFTDHCVTVGLGELTEREQKLIKTAKMCVDVAINKAIVGNTVGDIANALGTIADLEGFKHIIGFTGHGIGRSIHEDPHIPYSGKAGTGPQLKEGMVLCIENQISLGTGNLMMAKDGWTMSTTDGSKTAMFEHMVLVHKDYAEVLTAID